HSAKNTPAWRAHHTQFGCPARQAADPGQYEDRVIDFVLSQTFSTKLSTTRFSPALSKAMVSLLPSTATTLPLPNFWWKTRSPTANDETVPVDFATSSPSIVSGARPWRFLVRPRDFPPEGRSGSLGSSSKTPSGP